jgi:hypothetical protein
VRCIEKEKSAAFLVLNFEELTRYGMSGSFWPKNRHITSKAVISGRFLSVSVKILEDAKNSQVQIEISFAGIAFFFSQG